MSAFARIVRSMTLAACVAATGCVSAQTLEHGPARSTLVALGREYGRSSPPAKIATAKARTERSKVPSVGSQEGEESYKKRMSLYLDEQEFDQLDKAARDDRGTKARFPGGLWELFALYEALSEPTGRDQASESQWSEHIANLKGWVSARPQSIAAHLALAETYVNYAYKARGSGYADTVSESGWHLYGSRIALAASTLAEAAQLKEKCPYWYEVTQQVALAQGWDKSQARELFEQAVAFEPSYYHFYREYANFLLPKWYGEPGEAGTFAEEMSNRIGGQEGKFVYFEIASLVRCGCAGENEPETDNLSWPKIKEGYMALGQLYGYSNLKNNRFAHMAYDADDREAAQKALALVGSDWDQGVWHTASDFERAKSWASDK